MKMCGRDRAAFGRKGGPNCRGCQIPHTDALGEWHRRVGVAPGRPPYESCAAGSTEQHRWGQPVGRERCMVQDVEVYRFTPNEQ